MQTPTGPALLDELGDGWRLFAVDGVTADQMRSRARGVGHNFAIQVVAADALQDGGAVAAWLQARGAAGALVRPDFYVFGGAADPGGLERLIDDLVEQLYGDKAQKAENVACA